MAITQKMYLGEVPVIQNYFGENPIVSNLGKITYTIEYLVYAAGGRGGDKVTYSGGGGGAGGLLSGSLVINPLQVYQVAVGYPTSTNGQDSYFTGSNAYIYAFGGGKGGDGNGQIGSNGGSGGGSGGYSGAGLPPAGGTGSLGQGFNGASSGDTRGGGGGGASAAGAAIDGGAGKTSSISGISRTYCVGGRGESSDRGNAVSGSGGFGGMSNIPGFPTGTDGGPGQVIIRYLGPQKGTGGVVTTDGSYVIHTFSASGSATYVG
jgi:hypothetical protein